MPAFADRAWSPYVAGVLIGLLQVPAFLLMDTALGTSSSYVTLSGHAASLVDPAVAEIGYVAKHLSGAKNWWQVALVVGIALGAALSARASGTLRGAMSPVWLRTMGVTSSAARAPIALFGGFLIVFGARIADGCTSGHGLSGLAQLAVGSIVAVAAMFAGGIATAMLLRRA